MSAAPLDRAECLHLCAALTGGTITPEEHARLETLLARDDAARRLWFLHCDVESGLRRLAVAGAAGGKIVALDRTRAWPGKRWTPLALAAAVAVLGVVGSLLVVRPARVSAAELVQQALAAQAGNVDRCYRVGFRTATGAGPRPDGRETLLWTRGSRLCVEARTGGEAVLAWGRDERGGVWFAASPDSGGSFEPAEVPPRLAQLCDLRSLQTEQLLRTLLVHFDLRREPSPGGGETVIATLKPGHQDERYRSARLELDAESDALRRVEIERVAPGHGPVTVIFTLVQTGLRDDASYTLAGHLRPGASVAKADSAPGARARLLEQFIFRLRERP